MKLSAAVLVACHGIQANEPTFVGNDMRYTQEQIDRYESEGLDVSGMLLPDGYGDHGKAIVTDDHGYHKRWSNDIFDFAGPQLRVPYRFAPGQFSQSEEVYIEGIMDGMTAYVGGCIEFYNDSGTLLYPQKYVQFQSSSGGCWAQVGYVGHHPQFPTNQPVNLGGGCIAQMVIEHEFLHVMGMFHEQSRPDRDQYINIHWDNIIEQYWSQYQAMSTADWQDQNSAYDGDSVMHYPANGFGNGAGWTMTDKVTGEPVQWPRAAAMSAIDIEQLKLMYPEYCGAVTTAATTTVNTSSPTAGTTTAGTTTTGTQQYCDSITCDIVGEDCQEPTFFKCSPYNSWPRPVSQSGKLGVVELWGPTFSVDFQFSLSQTRNDVRNIFLMTPDNANDMENPFMIAVNVIPLGSKLLVSYGDLQFITDAVPLNEWNDIKISQNWAYDGTLVYSVHLNGNQAFSSVISDRNAHKAVSVHFSGPGLSAADARIDKFHISAPMVPCSGTCLFDSSSCPTSMVDDVVWVKNPKASRPYMSAPGGLYVKTVIKNLDILPTDLRTGPYTGFLMFSKKKCGKQFFKKVLDGSVKIQLFDNELFTGVSYDVNFMYMRESDSNNLVVQFRQNKKAGTGNTGNAKKDLVRVVYTGLESVSVSDPDKCFPKVQIAVMKDSLSAGGRMDWTKCVSTMRTLN